MSVFEPMSDYNYGELHLKRDGKTGLQAIIAIHDLTLGPALGGCRFIHYETDGDAINDALRLARGMSYKAAITGLPLGGGKSVIVKPRGDFDRDALFRSFGQFIDSLGGRYITAEDSGTKISDMDTIRTQTPHVMGVSKDAGGSGDPSPLTALGVRRGLEACVKSKLGRDDVEGLTIAVQGIGNVGYSLAEQLHERGAKLVVTDVNEAALDRAITELSATVVGLDDIFSVECDIFAPCALGGALNDQTIPQLKCKIVAGAANNQLAEERHGNELRDRGILYAPDYAINAGGLINVQSEREGYDADKAMTKIMAIYDTILEISERAKSGTKPTAEIADDLAEERLEAARG